ncbi:MAG: SprT-like domain-containing protein [Oscillospiraceae bacterium]|nr:SprT-like domain-containing protein [Oscillospiraceae bacterium]
MNDPDALLRAVIEQARAIGIPVAKSIRPGVVINTRAKKRFGCCIRRGFVYTIELSDTLLDADERLCRQTLAHEVLHTCWGCRDHGARWKAYADRMNSAYGYGIRRTQDPALLGIAVKPGTVNHLVVCERCGRRFERTRRSRLTEHPERYRCGCGGRLKLLY